MNPPQGTFATVITMAVLIAAGLFTAANVWTGDQTFSNLFGGHLPFTSWSLYPNGVNYSMKDSFNNVIGTNHCPEVLISQYLHTSKPYTLYGVGNVGLAERLNILNGTYSFCPSFSKLILYSNMEIDMDKNTVLLVPNHYAGILFQIGNSTGGGTARGAVNTINGGVIDENNTGGTEFRQWYAFWINCSNPGTAGDNRINNVHWYDAKTGIEFNYTHLTSCNNNQFNNDYGTNSYVMVGYNGTDADGHLTGQDGPSQTTFTNMVYEGNFNSKYFWVVRDIAGKNNDFFDNFAYDYTAAPRTHPIGCTPYVTCNDNQGQNTTRINNTATSTVFTGGNIDGSGANYTDLGSKTTHSGGNFGTVIWDLTTLPSFAGSTQSNPTNIPGQLIIVAKKMYFAGTDYLNWQYHQIATTDCCTGAGSAQTQYWNGTNTFNGKVKIYGPAAASQLQITSGRLLLEDVSGDSVTVNVNPQSANTTATIKQLSGNALSFAFEPSVNNTNDIQRTNVTGTSTINQYKIYSNMTITPRVTGIISIMFQADANNTVANAGCNFALFNGTVIAGHANGVIGANATLLGSHHRIKFASANEQQEAFLTYLQTTERVNTKEFITVGYKADGSGTCTFYNQQWNLWAQ